MSLLYSETNNTKAVMTYRISNGGGDQTTAPGRTVRYWNSSMISTMTKLNFDKSNVGAYSIGLNTIMISAN